MNLSQHIKKLIALVLAAVMLLGLVGCSGEATTELMDDLLSMAGLSYAPGQRLAGSAWINSDLISSIDETTELNLKDDFHTTINRDWILAQEGEEASSFDVALETLDEQMMSIYIPDGKEYAPDPAIMTQQELDHMEHLVQTMVALAGDTEKREQLGAEPLRPYLEAIDSITTMEEMTAYLCNENGNNFLQETLINAQLSAPIFTRDIYTVHLLPYEAMLTSGYYTILSVPMCDKLVLQESVKPLYPIMSQLGYSQQETDAMVRTAITFERRLINGIASPPDTMEDAYYNNIHTFEELQALQGNFPLTQLITSWGLEESETFVLHEPSMMPVLSKLYTEKHLEEMKTYFMIHTALQALPYLDAVTAEQYSTAIHLFPTQENPAPAPIEHEDPEVARTLTLLRDYVMPDLSVAVEQIYIGRHCSSELKQELKAFLMDIRDYYTVMLSETHWLSEETRQEAIRKLENMQMNVLYPDELVDYSSLNYLGYEDGGNLLDAAYQVRSFRNTHDVSKVNQPYDVGAWNLEINPTTNLNANYYLQRNNVNILAGILAGNFVYDPDAPVEVNYARLGMIVGHEITHAFDTTGYLYDAEGMENKWWTSEDEIAFTLRAQKLVKHYSSLLYLPGDEKTFYNGSLVQGEAIADMGGMKCMLGLAKEIPDFDYALFFESYAQLFVEQRSLSAEMLSAADVHPLGFLRTNVTVQQFDEFYETYDIGPGDGMYLAPEDRILVW